METTERTIEERSRRAARDLAAAAEAEGLVDVGFAFADSPFGPLLVAVTARGLVRLSYPDRDPEEELAEVARLVSPRVLESARSTDEVRRELDEYFGGRRTEFEVPVDLTGVDGFRRRILEATARIPFGGLRTYRQVAERAGNVRAVRAAGNALGSNPIPIVVPCHRVVRTGGGLGGYTGGLERKELLLRLEGALV
jgi:methylated-DNA-[protein]-cysteine S-methyltransferase